MSAAGDLVPLCAFAFYRDVQFSVTARMVTWFAMSDLIGQFFVVTAVIAPDTFGHDGLLCSIQAAGNWYSVWSSWGWTVAFAHTVRLCYNSAVAAHHLNRRPGRFHVVEITQERRWHAVCWLLPLVGVGTAMATDLFGPRANMPICTFRRECFALIANAPLWLALAYNMFAFISVHVLIQQVRDVSNGLLAPDAQLAFERRVRVWPRFTMYILTFVVSQLPEVVMLVVELVAAPTWGPTMNALVTAANSLSQMHGFLNGVIFCFKHRVLAHQQWASRRPCYGCGSFQLLRALHRLRTRRSSFEDADDASSGT